MGIHTVLCSLSPKREALLRDDPSLVREILEARREQRIPGLLDLGKTWDALRVLLTSGDPGADPADAVLGTSGQSFGPELSFGRSRLLEAARVRTVAEMLEALPPDVIARRFRRLVGAKVHGDYGSEQVDDPDADFDPCEEERTELTHRFEQLVALYRKAAHDGHSILVMVT